MSPCSFVDGPVSALGALPKAKVGLVNLVKVSDPRAVLEAALGPLALFEVLTGPEPAAEAAE